MALEAWVTTALLTDLKAMPRCSLSIESMRFAARARSILAVPMVPSR